ncbi:hypothetical protein MnTg02_01727 [bacterium MnTg02]|nr:hypothetical protein MnTg02_01727 [bacterium MnTg02]
MTRQNSHDGDFKLRPIYTVKQFYEEAVDKELSLNGIYIAIRNGDIPSKRIRKKILIPGAYVKSLQTM